MKRVLALTLMVMLMLGVAVVPAIAAPQPTGTVVFWGMDPNAVGSGNAEMIAALEELYPGLKVDAQTTPATEGYSTQDVTKLLAAIAAGNPPDVTTLDRFTASQFAARGALQPIDPFLADFEVDINEYAAYTVAEVTFDGKIWAVPNGTDTRLLYWNKDMFEAAGLDPNTPPKTWDELLDFAEKLTILDGDNISQIGFIPNYGNVWLYMYGFQNGAKFLSEDGRTAMLNDPKLVEAVEFMVKGYDLYPGGAAAVNAFQSSFLGEGDSPFIQRQVAMIIDGNWTMETYSRFAPDLNYGVALPPTPTGENQITWAGGWSWAIPAGAKNPEGGFAAARFFTSDGIFVQIPAILEYRKEEDPDSVYLPGLHVIEWIRERLTKEYVEDADINPIIKENFKVGAAAMDVAMFRPVTPVGEILWTEHVKMAEKSIYHELTPQEAAEAANEVVQAELDKFWAEYDAK